MIVTVLKNRVAWGHMAKNYEYFSDEIKEIVTYDEAVKIDKHNNNLSMLNPLIIERAGEDKCSEICKEIGLTVLKHDTLAVVWDTIEDYFAFLFTPVSSFLTLYGKCQTNDNWNLQCMSSLTPKLTSVYNLIGQYVFFACVIISIISAVIYSVKHRHIKYCDKQYLYIVCPFIFECILRSAVFSFPFRAPPNDRLYDWR